MALRVVHFLNQFFAGLGGEEKANLPPEVRPGPVGPGRLLQHLLGDRGEIVATLICGDTYFAEHPAEASRRLADLLGPLQPNILFAGPAFSSGRYGLACGEMARMASQDFKIAAVASMHADNPGVQAVLAGAYIVPYGGSAASLKEALPPLLTLGLKLAEGKAVSPEADGYLPRGLRKNMPADRPAPARALDMLLAKVTGRPFTSEIPIPRFDRVPPAPPVPDSSQVTVALVTESGLVPTGNPDRIESSRASRFARYSIGEVRTFAAGEFESVHGGYATDYANADPNRLVPLDVTHRLKEAGRIGRTHDVFYTTVGNGTSVSKAQAFGQAIADDLRKAGVQAAIFTST